MSTIIRNLMLITLLLGIRSSFGQTSRNLKQLDSLLEKAHTLEVTTSDNQEENKKDKNCSSLGWHLLASRAADAFVCKFSSFLFAKGPSHVSRPN